eukprot:scaffold3199_cov402-Prasinococcus_capsulatus_cf.AAC.2
MFQRGWKRCASLEVPVELSGTCVVERFGALRQAALEVGPFFTVSAARPGRNVDGAAGIAFVGKTAKAFIVHRERPLTHLAISPPRRNHCQTGA